MSEPDDADDIQVQLGRMLGFALVSVGLLLGGGIALILLAALFFRFLYGG